MIGTSALSFASRTRRLALVALASVGIVSAAGCRSVEQQSFETPEAAVDALVAALRPEVDPDRLKEVLGPDIQDALPSGDQVADRAAVELFLERYDRGRRIVDGPDGQRILEIDTDNWPFAFPIVQADGKWMFDTIAGLDELDNRRIGYNELDTIQTCLAIVDAQREYARLDVDGDGIREYARKFMSDDGKRNGLYWPTQEGQPLSPLGDLIAQAAAEGYERTDRVYHGYRFKLLTAQGPGAPGGEFDYLVRGKLIGGFGIVAWPAEYDRSGIKSFIVNQDGVVYEKDLGDNTDEAVRAMNLFDPAGWSRADG